MVFYISCLLYSTNWFTVVVSMKELFGKVRSLLDSQNLSSTIIRLVTVAVLYSHIIGYRLWFRPDAILTILSVPYIVYILIFIIISILCVAVIIKPRYVPILIVAMIISSMFNLHIMTPFWVNYVLLLGFARYDASLQLVVWSLGIQELWAGLNKFNPGYLNVINTFTKPFSSMPTLVVIAGVLVLLIPLFEILIGFGVLLRKRFTPYLTMFVHGGALIILVCFVHYGEIVWLWNVIIITLVWLLYKNKIRASFHFSTSKLYIVLILILLPFLQNITTLAYPFSYRMYTGRETMLFMDGHPYVTEFYQKTKSIPFESKKTFEIILRKKCVDGGFKTATIAVPRFLLRKDSTKTFVCNDRNLQLH